MLPGLREKCPKHLMRLFFKITPPQRAVVIERERRLPFYTIHWEPDPNDNEPESVILQYLLKARKDDAWCRHKDFVDSCEAYCIRTSRVAKRMVPKELAEHYKSSLAKADDKHRFELEFGSCLASFFL